MSNGTSTRDWQGILATVVVVGDIVLHVAQANFPNINTQVFDFAVPTVIAFYFSAKMAAQNALQRLGIPLQVFQPRPSPPAPDKPAS
jgi:hypothetical protein